MRAMTAKPKAKPAKSRAAADAEQFDRFRQFAREHGADDDADAAEAKVEKIIRPAAERR